MNWIFLALIAPFLWSILNHADKYLLNKYSHHSGVGGLLIFSSVFALIALPVVAFFSPSPILALTHAEIYILIATGIMSAIAILFYLYALEQEDASHIVPFWFLTPVFSYLFGIFFLGEQLSTNQIWGSAVTLLGALVLSLELEKKVSIKKRAAGLMALSSLFFALAGVFFKDTAIEGSFWQSLFWNQAGMVVFGIFCLTFITTFRRDFLTVCKVKSKELALLNIFGEIGQTLSASISYYVTLIAPISLVLLVEYTFQPVFVFLEGLILSKHYPHIIQEKISRKHLAQKIASMLIMASGVWMIVSR